MSARPTHPASGARRRAGWSLLVIAALTLAAPARATDRLDQSLAQLERLAGRQPADAQQQLAALLQRGLQLDERSALHVELIRALIADAQYRSDDVLAIAGRIRDRLRALGDARMQAQLEHIRASAFYELGRSDDGWAALGEELEQANRAMDDDLFALAMVNRVRFLMKSSDFESAAAAVADAERRVRGAQAGAEVAFSNALLAKSIDDWAMALRSYQRARDQFVAVGDRTGEADALAGGGNALRHLGRSSEAIAPMTAAAGIYHAVNDLDGGALVTQNLALVYADLKRPALALATLADAMAALARLNEPLQLASARVEHAALLVQFERAGDALPLIEQARPVILAQGELALQARLHQTAAAALAAVGRFQPAYREIERVQEIEHRRVEQLVTRQLAVQRGRLESERLSRENALLRAEAGSGQKALAEANRARRLQEIALALGATIIVGAVFAVWRQRGLMRRIAQMAEIDALTGVPNRRRLLESGQRMMNRCRRDGRPCALLMIDVDRFKDINDRHGHVVGDRALRAIAAALEHSVRPGDQIGRYGGEEFAVVLPGADAGEAGVIAERLRAAVGALAPDWAPGAPALTISGGIAMASAEVADINELVVRADRALYLAKKAGRNRMEYDIELPLVAA